MSPKHIYLLENSIFDKMNKNKLTLETNLSYKLEQKRAHQISIYSLVIGEGPVEYGAVGLSGRNDKSLVILK